MKTKFNPWIKNLQYVVDNITDLTTINNVVLTGVSGDGYFQAKRQTTNPSAPVSGDGFKLFADSLGRFGWIGENGFVRAFEGTANTADRVYTLPDASGTFAFASGFPGGQNINGGTNAGENLILNSTSNTSKGVIKLARNSNSVASSIATQVSSQILSFESSLWTSGNAEVKRNFTIQAIASTTTNDRTDFYLKSPDGSTVFFIPSSSRNLFYNGGMFSNLSSVTTTDPNATTRVGVQNVNTTVNNLGAFVNLNANSMWTAAVTFRNISHSATVGSAEASIWLANGATPVELFIFKNDGSFEIPDGITAPTTTDTGKARVYIDTADGDLKIRFSDGVVKTIVVDS